MSGTPSGPVPVVPIHPQARPGRADELHWVTPADAVPFVGPVAAAPAALAALLDDGTLAALVWEPTGLVTRLSPGRSWADDGPRVRTALHGALARSDGWQPAAADGDEALRATVLGLLDGAVGDVARAHGGDLQLVQVSDGVVRVRLTGACQGCPAARSTLHDRLEAQLRRHCPQLRAVVAEPAARRQWAGRGSPR